MLSRLCTQKNGSEYLARTVSHRRVPSLPCKLIKYLADVVDNIGGVGTLPMPTRFSRGPCSAGEQGQRCANPLSPVQQTHSDPTVGANPDLVGTFRRRSTSSIWPIGFFTLIRMDP